MPAFPPYATTLLDCMSVCYAGEIHLSPKTWHIKQASRLRLEAICMGRGGQARSHGHMQAEAVHASENRGYAVSSVNL